MGGVPPSVRVRAPAKLNLGLRILDRRADGYHTIETLFVPLRVYDELEIALEDGPGVRLDVRGDASSMGVPSDASNLAVRAALAVAKELVPDAGILIRLIKKIPVAAGLGGGSADAAAVILGLEALARRNLPRELRAEIARDLGADVPFFLHPRPAVGRGIGDLLEPLPGLPEMWWLLVSFPFGVSTQDAYRAASAELTLPQRRSSIATLLGPSGVVSAPKNDLETVCTRLHPEVGTARRALDAVGAIFTGMSGSGPTVYGRFETRASALEASRRVDLPHGAQVIAASSPGSDAENWGWGVAKR